MTPNDVPFVESSASNLAGTDEVPVKYVQ